MTAKKTKKKASKRKPKCSPLEHSLAGGVPMETMLAAQLAEAHAALRAAVAGLKAASAAARKDRAVDAVRRLLEDATP